jgi:hypothetical protein
MRVLVWAIFLTIFVAIRLLAPPGFRLVLWIAVVVAMRVFRRPLVIALTHMASKLGLMKGTVEKMPDEIHLTRDAGPTEPAQPILAALRVCDFVDAGAWHIAEMPKVHVHLMVNPQAGILAAVESATSFGAHVNLHTLYSDGSVASFTNSQLPAQKVAPPNALRVRYPKLPPDTLVERACSERPAKPFRPLKTDEAAGIYEHLYAQNTRFRKQQHV